MKFRALQGSDRDNRQISEARAGRKKSRNKREKVKKGKKMEKKEEKEEEEVRCVSNHKNGRHKIKMKTTNSRENNEN